MTTINDINDLARILRENPEWADTLRSLLLSRELQNLPQVTAELATAVKAVHDRMEALEGEVKAQGRRLDTVQEDIVAIRGDITTMQGDMATMQGDMTTMRGDITTMRGDLTTVQGDMATMRGDLTTVQGDMADMKHEQAIQGGRIAYLIGDDYKSKAAWFGRRRLRTALGVPAVQLLYHYRKQGKAALAHIIKEAMRHGGLSPQDADDLEDSDLIFMVRQDPAQSEPDAYPDAYVVAEASVTIQESDVERARRRAGILDSVTQIPVTPAVIGVSITLEALDALANDVLAVGMDAEGQPCNLSEAPDEAEETLRDDRQRHDET